MNRGSCFLLVLVLLVALLQCGNDPLSPIMGSGDLTQAEMRLVESDNKFGLKIFRELVSQGSPDSSVLISPLSLSMALGMTFNGAAGSTEQAMRTTLEYETLTLDEINDAYRDLVQRLTG